MVHSGHRLHAREERFVHVEEALHGGGRAEVEAVTVGGLAAARLALAQ